MTINQLDLIDIYRSLDLSTEEYTFFSSASETFIKIEHILGHNISLNKLLKTQHKIELNQKQNQNAAWEIVRFLEAK